MALIDSDYFNLNMKQLGLKSSFSPDADALVQLIAEASQWVENYCRRKIESGQVVEIVPGKDSYRLILDEYPVTALTSLTWDDFYGASGTISLDSVRTYTSGILEFKNRFNLEAPFLRSRIYTVTYTAGFDPVPDVVKRATALKVVDLFSPQYQGPREARQVEFVDDIDGTIVDLLEPYRRDRVV